MTGNVSLPDTFDQFSRALDTMARNPHCAFPLSAISFLPPFPDLASLPPQESPFEIPDTLAEFIQRLQSPVQLPMPHLDRPEFRIASMPRALLGGETRGQQRIRYIIETGIASSYHFLWDGLPVGDENHGLSSYLALGCITARQVHQELLKLELGTDPSLAQTLGFGTGCSAGTETIRHYLRMASFIRLSIIKYGSELYNLEGAGMGKNPFKTWKSPVIQELDRPGQAVDTAISMTQFLMGLTGFGLIDAIMRQLYVTGQMTTIGEEMAIDFFALHAGLDWRYGAEYVSSLSTDHDPFFHFYISQNSAGVGPNNEAEVSQISPVQMSLPFDPYVHFIRRWMPELRSLPRRSNLFRVNTTECSLLQRYGLASSIMVTRQVPYAMPVESITITETTGANRAQMENTVALARREDGPIHIADLPTETIREGSRFEEFGSGSGFEDQSRVEALLGLPEPNELPQGPPPVSWGPSLPFPSDHDTAKAQVASTTSTREPTTLAEATVLWNIIMALHQRNPLGHHPVVIALLSSSYQQTSGLLIHRYILHLYLQPPPVQLPQLLPAQPSSYPLDTPASQPSNQSYYAAALSLHPQSQPPPLLFPVDVDIPPHQQRNLSGNQSPARLLPLLPAAPSPPPPPPTLPSAIPHQSHEPQVPLPREDTLRASIEEDLSPLIVIPLRRSPRRLRPRIAVIPHPALAGFLPVVAEPEIIRYYIGQLRQMGFQESLYNTLIDLPFLDNNRVHIISCPRGVEPLRGDPDFDIFRNSLPPALQDVDLGALDELIDELEDDEVAVQGPRDGYTRRGSTLLRPYRGPRQPSRFNFRYR